MTVNQCVAQMLEVEETKKGGSKLTRTRNQYISKNEDFGAPLHCVVIPGNMHILEKEHFDFFSVSKRKGGN
jgi:diphthamide biosynthesis methyltransferase